MRGKPGVSLLYGLGKLQELPSGRYYGRYFSHRNLDRYMRARRDEMRFRIVGQFQVRNQRDTEISSVDLHSLAVGTHAEELPGKW